MAFTSTIAGDRYILPESGNVKPKVPKSGYTPVRGDLVILDTSIAEGVDILTTDENPYGMVENINTWTSAAVTRPISVAEFYPGCEVEFNYTGTVALGDKVEFSSATRDTILGRTKVKADNTNGVGSVIAVDASAPHGTGYCVVRFA